LDEIAWYKERLLRDISLGSLLVVMLVRTTQTALSKLRGSYLPVHCLAALGNMSMYLESLHPYAAYRIINLFEMFAKMHNSLLRRINKEEAGSTLPRTASSPLLSAEDNEDALAHVESCMEVLLQILNSCLTNALRPNPQLSYSLLHEKALFLPYAQHPRFSHLLFNIQAVLEHFEFLMSEANIPEWTPEAILDIIQRGSLTWQSREYPLQFTYEEEDNAQNFFVPFLWDAVVRSTAPDLNWNLDNARIFTTKKEESGSGESNHLNVPTREAFDRKKEAP